ncbi:MAG: ABC transporter permease [Peptococcaceae bacterium]|nr:ABC transporter permease [Peptococcaceae bacterium]
MTVFKACFMIVKRHYAALALYFSIFMVLAVAMTALSADNFSTDFSATRPAFTLITRDGHTPLLAGLASYLREHGNEVVLDDRTEALQDASFYHATDYIAIVPQGFHDAFFDGEPLKIETVLTTESAKGYYADRLVTQYLNLARLYQAAGDIDEETIISSVLKDLSIEAPVEKKHFGAGAPVNEGFQLYAQIVCYIIIVLIILCISNITSAFRRPDLRMRNLCAPTKPRSFSGQQILCGAVVSIAAWLLLMTIGFALYGSQLSGTDGRIIGLILLNTFIVTVVALSLASLASLFIRSPNSQSAAANLLALGLCFLGGVFVPLHMMGESILTVSKFTPTYWYSTALEHICTLTSFGGDVLAPVWQAMLMQLAFALAIFCVALVISKYQNQSERFFSSIQTELEA